MKVHPSSSWFVRIRQNKRFQTKCAQGYLSILSRQASTSHTSNHETRIVEANKKEEVFSTKTSSNISAQLKTAASVFLSVLKTGVSSSTASLSAVSDLVKKVPLGEKKPSSTNGVFQQKKTEESFEHYKSETKSGLAYYVKLMGGSDTKVPETPIPRWKLKRRSVSQESIDARTLHVVSSVAKAITKPSLLLRLEDMCHHLFQFPQAKSLAAREGAVSMLLRLKHSFPRDELLLRQIREGLALLGYAEPLPSKGIRILTIDGGGTRGLLALRILRHLEQTVGRPIYECFDYVCGVSTGAIVALLIGAGRKSVDNVEAMYRDISSEVFRQDRSSGLGSLIWSHAYYDTQKFEKILKDKIGESIMIRTTREPSCLKVAAISTVVNHDGLWPYVFRNYTLPFRIKSLYNGSFRHRMWEACRASSAAPGYFGEFKLEENIHQDGGLFVNNPTAIAIHEAKCLWPNAKLQSVVSIGTGRCQPLNMATSGMESADMTTTTTLRQKLTKVIDSATDTERVHNVLHDLLPPKVYYRFNPYLNEIHGLDETDPERWDRMLEDVDMYIRKNERKMKEAASTLMAPRSKVQAVQDWVSERKFLLQNISAF